MFTRRGFLVSATTLALNSGTESQSLTAPHSDLRDDSGWQTLPLGCGGLVTGFDVAPDGTMVCRTDVGNCYRWSGTTANIFDPAQRWIPLMTYASLGGEADISVSRGAYELVIAPSRSTNLYGIMGDNSGLAKWWLYRSTNSGQSWIKTNLSMLNADSNVGNKKNAAGKVAVDPINPDVVYCGMPPRSGAPHSVCRTIDGQAFDPIPELGSTTLDPGVCGMCFDQHHGTISVRGQLRTARIIIPVGGVGIFESLDGGDSFRETTIATMKQSNISVYQGKMDYDGVYYAIVSTDGENGYLWRYSGPGGTWEQLDVQGGWRQKPGWIGQGNLIVDPRNGHQGYLTASGPNGIGTGYTSTNANAHASTVRWGGGTYTDWPALKAPDYDVPWLANLTKERVAFLYGTHSIIDQHGTCWWSGQRGFWYFDSIPNFSETLHTVSHSVARGMEVTVAEDVCCPPGGTLPVLAAQDVGIMRGTFTDFPTDYYVSGRRMDCHCLDWAASDPSFMVARVSQQRSSSIAAGALSAYSAEYGKTASWVGYANQADLMYQGVVVGSISDGSGGAGDILSVNRVLNGTVLIGQGVYIGNINKGQIIAYGTGAGSEGTYKLDKSNLTTLGEVRLTMATQGGAVVAVDHDHHICVPSGYNGSFVPVYTSNATSPSCSWQFCSGLPQAKWTNRSFVFGSPAKPLATDRVEIGNVYAALLSPTQSTKIYRSHNNGASFTQVGSLDVGNGGNFSSCVLYSVPGHAGHLWFTARFTSGHGSGIWRSTNGGETWSPIRVPGGGVPRLFCLGAPHSHGAYPTLYCVAWQGYKTESKFFSSIDEGKTWSKFGRTGTQADLPPVSQICGIHSISADWSIFGRVYASSNQSGFAFHRE
jgi:hypothetical protein